MQGIGSGVIAEILAALLIAVIGWLLSVVLRMPFVYRQRRGLFEFFGVTQDNQRLLVYLSTLFVASGGSADFRGTRRTFQGPAIPDVELTTVQPVSQLLSNSLEDYAYFLKLIITASPASAPLKRPLPFLLLIW